MAAGISPEREYRIIYRKLQGFLYELDNAGVEATYKDRAVRGHNTEGLQFVVSYRRLNASNGECALIPSIQILDTAGKVTESFGSTFSGLVFEKGMLRLKEVFSKVKGAN